MSQRDLAEIFLLAGKRKVGLPTLEIQPGAHSGSTRLVFEEDDANCVFIDTVAGFDASPGTRAAPKKTYAAAAALVGTGTITTVCLLNETILQETISVQTQADRGIKPEINTSIAGENWNIIDTKVIVSSAISIATDGDQTIVYVFNDRYRLSTDKGATWNDFTLSVGKEHNSVHWDGEKFIISIGLRVVSAFPGEVLIFFSSDGVTWSQGLVTTQQLAILNIIASNDNNTLYVGASNSKDASTNPYYYISTDGILWEIITTQSANDIFVSVTFGNGLFVAVTLTNKIFSSVDTKNWTLRHVPVLSVVNYKDIIWNGLIFLVVAQRGTVISSDGISWTEFFDTTIQLGNPLTPLGFGRALVWNGTNFLTLVIKSGDPSKKLAISSNGQTWILFDNPGFTILNAWFFANIGNIFYSATNNVASTEINIIESKTEVIVNSPLCGFKLSDSATYTITDGKLYNCSMQTDIEAINITATVDLRRNDIRATNALIINDDVQTIQNNLIVGTISLTYTSNGLQIILKSNTIVGNINLTNNSSTGLETIFDNIMEGDINATLTPAVTTIKSGNIRGSRTGFLLISENITSLDPLFDALFRLQREVGYGDSTAAFDSPLINSSKFALTLQGLPRDMGAWSFDDSNITEEFSRAISVPKPERDNFKFINLNKFFINEGLSGQFDTFNDVDKRGERIEWTWKGVTKEVFDFFEFLELQKDTTVNISIDPILRTTLPNVTVNGAHAIGDLILNINTVTLFTGARLTIGNVEYFAVYSVDANNAITFKSINRIVLSQPLQIALTGGESIGVTNPIFLGEFTYVLQPTRTYRRIFEWEDEWVTDLSVVLVRKQP